MRRSTTALLCLVLGLGCRGESEPRQGASRDASAGTEAQTEPSFRVTVTPKAMLVRWNWVIGLDAGVPSSMDSRNHFIRPLYELLEPDVFDAVTQAESAGQAWDEPLHILADPTTPYMTLVDVMNTTGVLGFGRFELALSSEGGESNSLPILLPAFRPRDRKAPQAAGQGAMALPMLLTLEVTTEGVSVGRGGQHSEQLQHHPLGDPEAITNEAKALRKANPAARQVVVSAEGDVPLAQVVALLEAARGELPELILLGAHAHSYVYVPPEEAEPVPGWRGLHAGPERRVGEVFTTSDPSGLMALGLFGEPDRNPPPEPSPRPRIRPRRVSVDGEIDGDIVRRIVRAHNAELMRCYEQALERDPTMGGDFTVNFKIGRRGQVSNVSVSDAGTTDEKLRTCVIERFSRWKFTKGTESKVSFPFTSYPAAPVGTPGF